HRDELLFQTVHQSTELWLKHACFELTEAAALVRGGSLDGAVRLIRRACLAVQFVTAHLEMLRLVAPQDFAVVRTVLGHGSGYESPGWQEVHRVSQRLGAAFSLLLAGLRTEPL